MKKVKIIALILAAILALCGCVRIVPQGISETPGKTEKLASAEPASDKWTVMIYMNGSDLESKGGEATANLQSLLLADIPQNIDVLIYTGGTAQWQNDVIDARQNQIWRVRDDGIELIESIEPQSMGESATLAEFIVYSHANFPADKKALIFWNHGAGSIIGFGADELFDLDSLCLPEMSDAFKSSFDGNKFELIGFDACLMASVETASILEPYAKYMVASEEFEPGGGWDYEDFFTRLSNNPYMDGRELGIAITDGYYNKYQGRSEEAFITLSVTDLSKIPKLEQMLGMYASQLSGSVSSGGPLSMLASVRHNAESYGDEPGAPSFDTVDLHGFISLQKGLDDKLCAQILTAIEDAVVYKKSGSNRIRSNGLSIYFPFKAKEYFQYNLQVYGSIDFCPEYKEFAKSIATLLNDKTVTSGVPGFDGGIYDASTGEAMGGQDYSQVGSYYVQLTDEEMSYMSYVYCTLGWYVEDTLIDLGYDSYLTIDYSDNTIHDDFGGWWTGLNGQPAAVYVMEETDDYIIYSIPVEYNGERAIVRGAWFWDESLEASGYYTYNGIYYANEQGLPGTRKSIELKAGDLITPIYPVLHAPDGYEGYYIGETFTVDENGLYLSTIWLSNGVYQYGFMFIDCYGNTHYSDTIDFEFN